MDYIILDIEFNGRKFASDLPMEVIEIGAVRLDESLKIVNEFSSLIKPVYFPKLNNFIKKKTGIPQDELDIAPGFPPVIAEFEKWLGSPDSFLLFTWGGEDIKRIVFDTRMHKLNEAYWTGLHYFDLLKGYLRYKKVTNDVSVEAALLDLGIAPEGSAHRALDDARMTAEVFRKIAADLDLSLKQQYKDQFSNSKERRLIKNAVRTMISQKKPQTWEAFVESYLAEKIPLTDPRKAAELRDYFHSELEKKQ
ncbi:3'-5' exonuclease [Cohnella phaseoli]|uniref:Inhibitor of KinA sporulation pathway (Predicted exonuclease) n=1 Tax=Cohnella phaseoli TaxID=456490 RepID=A0A3D9ILK8_9BACL|nr:3'-5' exonuclease [Cohnella phaseoli]RED61986.1 inhibitor of KinA sporulation pathway (predicted exonuclease) [Cohnella phaseoli]